MTRNNKMVKILEKNKKQEERSVEQLISFISAGDNWPDSQTILHVMVSHKHNDTIYSSRSNGIECIKYHPSNPWTHN